MSTTHTFYNLIYFPEERQDEAFAAWQAIGRFMETQPGFLGSMLYRSRRDPRRLINKGAYASEAAFMGCVRSPKFQALSQKLTELGVEREAGLFDEVESFGAGPAM